MIVKQDGQHTGCVGHTLVVAMGVAKIEVFLVVGVLIVYVQHECSQASIHPHTCRHNSRIELNLDNSCLLCRSCICSVMERFQKVIQIVVRMMFYSEVIHT